MVHCMRTPGVEATGARLLPVATVANFQYAPGFPPRVLRVARALAAGMFDDGGPIPVAPAKLDAFVADLGEFLRYVGPKTRLALRASLLVVQASPVWVIGTPARFTSLSRDDRARFLEKAERTHLPLVMQGLKTVVSILWYDLNPDELPQQHRTAPRAGVAHAATRRRA